MLVTPDGIVTLVSFLQSWNADSPMLVSALPSANVTLSRLPQERNALAPMLVTRDGISMLPRPLPENA